MNPTARLFPLLTCLCLTSHAVAGEGRTTAASSADAREPVTLKFRYDRRELQSHEGALRIHRRLVRAARLACLDPDSPRVEQRGAEEQCMPDLVEQVVARIDSAQLTSVHGTVARKWVAASR